MRKFRGYRAAVGVLCLLWAWGCREESNPIQSSLTDGSPGTDCFCDIDCDDGEDARGICVFGICMNRPAAGPLTQPTCPEGMRLLEVYEYGGLVCYPECEHFACEGKCDQRGLCVNTEDTDFWCDPRCSAYCSGDPPSLCK